MALPLFVLERLDALKPFSQLPSIYFKPNPVVDLSHYSTLLSVLGAVVSSKLVGKLIFAAADLVTASAIHRVLLLIHPGMSNEKATMFTLVSV